jgi:galactokinase
MQANDLVTAARPALPDGDMEALGELMEAAHWHCRGPGDFDAGKFKDDFSEILKRAAARHD